MEDQAGYAQPARRSNRTTVNGPIRNWCQFFLKMVSVLFVPARAMATEMVSAQKWCQFFLFRHQP